jgi:antitoxin ParD1/3/4
MVSKNTSIALGPDLEAFARRKVASGEYGSISEVIRDAMRRAVERDAKVEALRAAIQEGIDSGPPTPFDFEEFRQEMQARYKGAA